MMCNRNDKLTTIFLLATVAICAMMAGCAGVDIYDSASGKLMKNKGVRVAETEPWLAIKSDGSVSTVEIPNGNVREYRPYSFLSRVNVSMNVRETGSIASIGLEKGGGSEAIDAIKETAIKAATRGFSEGGSDYELILVRSSTLTQEHPEVWMVRNDGTLKKR